MVSVSRCLSSLAFLGVSSGARMHRHKRDADTKFIAGVPVLNYHEAYAGEMLGMAGAEEEWVVMVKPGVTDTQISDMCGVATNGCRLSGNPSKEGVPFFEMRGTEQDLEAVIESGHGAIRYIEPDMMVHAIPEVQADMHSASATWGLDRIGAHKRGNEGAGVSIFVCDTGIRATHEDFGGRVIPAVDFSMYSPKECDGEIGCAGDVDGHGTHCAGSAAGATLGVAPAATIRTMKVLGDNGGGQFSWSYAALDWIVTSGIRPAIASMSLGARGNLNAMKDSIDSATSAGVTVVVAAGNSNQDACEFSPAFVPNAITVGSTDRPFYTDGLDRRSSFSNYGQCTGIWAPGRDVKSASHAHDDGTAMMSGTSMACPHVAGGAALVLERNPNFGAASVLQTLQANGRANTIEHLRRGDTSILLYVGIDAPPPSGELPDPLPPTPGPVPVFCPSATTSGPFGDTVSLCNCKRGLWCHFDGQLGECTTGSWSSGKSSRWYDGRLCDASRCVCKAREE